MDEITDDELLHFMKEQYEEICFGDLDYLESTCLSNFAQAIRAGYSGFRASDGRNEYGQFDEVTRWIMNCTWKHCGNFAGGDVCEV